jgi:hypothetical protein
MGEDKVIVFRPEFNRSVKVEVSPTLLTEDSGALLLREAAEKLDLINRFSRLVDHRDPDRTTHPLSELMMTRILLLAQGWVDQDDADELRDDPAFRVAVSSRAGEGPLLPADEPRQPDGLPSQPTLSRLQSMLASEHNLRVLSQTLLETGIARMKAGHGRRPLVILDVDSFADQVHGAQRGAAYNGHYQKECYHPLIAFTDTGDIMGIQIRPGNVPSARDVRSFLTPIIEGLRQVCDEILVRMDAGFADGKLYAWLRHMKVRYILRLKSNSALGREIAEWEERVVESWATPAPDGKPREETREFWYRAKSWTYTERVVAVAVERTAKQAELFHNVFYLVTNTARPVATSLQLLETYRQRGNAERFIGDFVGTVAPTLSSVPRCREGAPCHHRPVGMAENGVSLFLAALAYELMHLVRSLLKESDGDGFSLRRLRERLLKVATAVVKHSRRIHFRISSSKADLWKTVAERLAVFGVVNEVPQGT